MLSVPERTLKSTVRGEACECVGRMRSHYLQQRRLEPLRLCFESIGDLTGPGFDLEPIAEVALGEELFRAMTHQLDDEFLPRGQGFTIQPSEKNAAATRMQMATPFAEVVWGRHVAQIAAL